MKTALTRFWFGHILVILAVIVLGNLGLWQLRRLEQRRALNAEIMAGLNAATVTLTGQPVNPDELHRHRVQVTGVFDNVESIVIRNRPFQSQPGSELVVPLKIAGSDQAVLVNRGWIPLDETDRETRRKYDIEGEVAVNGIAYRSQPQPSGYLVALDPTPGPGQDRLDIWFRVDIDRIQDQVGTPLLPIFIEQSPNPDAGNTPPRREENLEPDEGSHLGYAVQWFTFALVLVAVYSAFVWQEVRKQNNNNSSGEE